MSKDDSSRCTSKSLTVGDNKRLSFLRSSKLVCYPKAWIKHAVAPLVSLKLVQLTRVSAGSVFLFFLKLTALELLRRVSRARCPELWWGLQTIPLLHIPKLSWLQKCSPLKYFLTGTQAFSKPMICLSLASTVSNVLEWKKDKDCVKSSAGVSSSNEQASVHRYLHEEEGISRPSTCELALRQVLDKDGVILIERISDDELENVLLAARGNVKRAAENVKKMMIWRENFQFLPSLELEKWSYLVFWHGHDAKLRPILVIRLGAAYSNLSLQWHPEFAQAVISQVEYGVLNLVHQEDPRILVVMDCVGTSVLRFPVHLMKSCCVCLQQNYPTRLACLIAINVPAVVRVIATTIIQVLRPETRRKVIVEGENYTRLFEGLEGFDHISLCVNGSCKCSACAKAYLESNQANFSTAARMTMALIEDQFDTEQHLHNAGQFLSCQAFKILARKIVIGVLMLWILMTTMVALSTYPNEET